MSTQSTSRWSSDDGSFKRQVSSFRETVSHSHPVFKPAANRYWLYVSLACPWAHRTLITRYLKGLTGVIGVSVVHWHLDEKGWRFLPYSDQTDTSSTLTAASGVCTASTENAEITDNRVNIDGTIEHQYHLERLSELYAKANPDYSARWTVPVLWDTQTQTIVNNESSEILRILNESFNEFATHPEVDISPKDKLPQIDELNTWIYDGLNNGVYKAGFATKQEVYQREAKNVFATLDKVEALLKEQHNKGSKFLLGDSLTEVDVRTFPTVVRFDPVYVQHFKCNLTTIRAGYPHINQWLKDLYWTVEGFKETTDFGHIKWHYTKSHKGINPLGITPVGPLPHIESL